MKHILVCATLFATLGITSSLRAQESAESELEMVRKLREKGWNDLAKVRIEELLKRNDSTLNAALPLELARLNISIARQLDPDQRLALFGEARAHLEKFIKQNQGKTEAALAAVELARVTSYHAQAILSRAMRDQDTRTRHEKARPAEVMFIQAGKDLEAAIKVIEAALPNAPASMKPALEQEQRQAKFDLAINIFDQAKTYIDRGKDKVNQARSETMLKAIKSFTALRSDDSTEIGWLANAWLMKCSMETTDPDNVVKYHKSVMDRQKDPAVQPAVRLVRYFAMQDMTIPRADEPETIGNFALAPKKTKMSALDRLHAVQKEGEAWLKAYPNQHRTYEGQGVRFELAQAYMAEAFEAKDPKVIKTLFAHAGDNFKKLADYDGELSERARELHMQIRFKTVAEAKTELKDFDDFVMKAMIERRSVIEISRKMDDPKLGDTKMLEAERKKHLKEVIVALNKALSMSDSKTPVAKVDDARYYLCGAYLAYGDPYRAAIVGEALGRSRSTRRSPEGASTAIATYASLQSRHPDDTSIRKRLEDMAAFVLSPEVQSSWKTDPVTSMAHYHLAMAAKREDDPKLAISHLEKLSPDFIDYIYTQGQLVFIAQAAREKTEDPKEQQFYIAAAKAALNRMPMYSPKDDSGSIIAMYYFAKLEMPKFMYSEAMENLKHPSGELKAIKRLGEMATLLREMQNQIGTLPGKAISPDNREQIEFSVSVLLKYSDLGIAEAKFRGTAADRFDQVLKATKTVVDDVIKKGSGAGEIAIKDYRVTADILSLALRANVQKGNIKEGKAILDVLGRLTGTKGEKAGNVVGVLLNDIAGQIRSMKEAKDKKLDETRKSYDAFLDVIAKEYETKGEDVNATLMLAHAYMSLDLPAKAADHFAKVKQPPAGKENEEAMTRYWGAQIEHIRALRATKEKDALKKAEAACKAIIENKEARYHIQAMVERGHVMEDQERFYEATAAWSILLKTLSPNRSKPEVQKIYFPAYYQYTRSLFLTSEKDKAKLKNPAAYLTGAANNIINLEFSKSKEGWDMVGPMFVKLLKDPDFDKLKKEYDRLKAIQQKTSSPDVLRPMLGAEVQRFETQRPQRARREFISEFTAFRPNHGKYSRILNWNQE